MSGTGSMSYATLRPAMASWPLCLIAPKDCAKAFRKGKSLTHSSRRRSNIYVGMPQFDRHAGQVLRSMCSTILGLAIRSLLFPAPQVEYLCRHPAVRPPRWTGSPEYVLDDPWFGYSDAPAGLRAILIRDAPAEYKNRNLFTTSEIEWRPRRGRPRKSLEEHREKTRLRQRRWRKAQASSQA